jgi:hypothetical protein
VPDEGVAPLAAWARDGDDSQRRGELEVWASLVPHA